MNRFDFRHQNFWSVVNAFFYALKCLNFFNAFMHYLSRQCITCYAWLGYAWWGVPCHLKKRFRTNCLPWLLFLAVTWEPRCLCVPRRSQRETEWELSACGFTAAEPGITELVRQLAACLRQPYRVTPSSHNLHLATGGTDVTAKTISGIQCSSSISTSAKKNFVVLCLCECTGAVFDLTQSSPMNRNVDGLNLAVVSFTHQNHEIKVIHFLVLLYSLMRKV